MLLPASLRSSERVPTEPRLAPRQLAADHPDRQPAARARHRRRVALAPDHPRVRLLDDHHLGADRRPASRPRPRPSVTGATSRSPWSASCSRTPTNNMINDYFDTIGRRRHRGVRRAPSTRPHPLFSNLISKEGLIATILACNARRPRDRHLADGGARLAGRRLRARRTLHQRLLRCAAAQAEAPRSRRARRLRGVGAAHDRRHLLRDRRHAAVVDLARLGAVRARS